MNFEQLLPTIQGGLLLILVVLLFNYVINNTEKIMGALQLNPITEVLELSPIGNYSQGGRSHNLSEYFVDRAGQLYSRNTGTWEISKKDGRDILICSNGSEDYAGNIINSLRSGVGTKVTVKRDNFSFNPFNTVNLVVEPLGSRHLTIKEVI